MKIIEDFFKKLDVTGLGRGNVKKIMNVGFDTIPKILKASIEDLETVQGFKIKPLQKFIILFNNKWIRLPLQN